MNKKEPLSDRELYDLYDQFLDEIYEPTKIGGYEYSVSIALERVDPIAYKMGFSDWLDAQCQDGLIHEGRDGDYFDGPDKSE